jgi:hygromycin-B 7''-O-kinase
MNHPPPWPAEIGVQAFDALHDDLPAWRGAVESLATGLGGGPVRQMADGTVLVALLGTDRVLKLYPPFLRDHWAFECATLALLEGALPVPTPRLLERGELGAWPWLLMSQLQGQPLTGVWPALPEPQRLALLEDLGRLCAAVHALPAETLQPLSPAWSDFLATQLARCVTRQRRTGLPAHLQAQLSGFLQGELPGGPPVVLTGEYTPMNLLVQGPRLSGLFDFGDGLVGPRAYDWLGPLCFLAAGRAARCAAFFHGYGVAPGAKEREALLRLLLLHRYSNLPAQIAHPGWQGAPSFEALAALIWPL